MTLPSKMYKDPAKQLLDREAETCKGCAHLDRVRSLDYCQNPDVKSVLAGRRCGEYEEVK